MMSGVLSCGLSEWTVAPRSSNSLATASEPLDMAIYTNEMRVRSTAFALDPASNRRCIRTASLFSQALNIMSWVFSAVPLIVLTLLSMGMKQRLGRGGGGQKIKDPDLLLMEVAGLTLQPLNVPEPAHAGGQAHPYC